MTDDGDAKGIRNTVSFTFHLLLSYIENTCTHVETSKFPYCTLLFVFPNFNLPFARILYSHTYNYSYCNPLAFDWVSPAQ